MSTSKPLNFKYVQEGMKYLEIRFIQDLEEMSLLNLNALLHKIKTNLDTWEKLEFILWGKISNVKMITALRFN